METKHRTKAEEKARRREEQEENVARRKAEKEEQTRAQRSGKSEKEGRMEVDDDDVEASDVDPEEMLLELENEIQGG